MVSRLTFHSAEKTHPKPFEVRRDLWTSVSFAAGPQSRTGDSPCSPPTGTCVAGQSTCCALHCPGGGEPFALLPCPLFPPGHSLLAIQKSPETAPLPKLKPEGLCHVLPAGVSHPENTLLPLTPAGMGDHLAPLGAGSPAQLAPGAKSSQVLSAHRHD